MIGLCGLALSEMRTQEKNSADFTSYMSNSGGLRYNSALAGGGTAPRHGQGRIESRLKCCAEIRAFDSKCKLVEFDFSEPGFFFSMKNPVSDFVFQDRLQMSHGERARGLP